MSDHQGKVVNRTLVDDLANVLSSTCVGWKPLTGIDLSQHPEVQRVMARYRKSKETGLSNMTHDQRIRLLRAKAAELESIVLARTNAGLEMTETDQLRADISLLYTLVADHLDYEPFVVLQEGEKVVSVFVENHYGARRAVAPMPEEDDGG